LKLEQSTKLAAAAAAVDADVERCRRQENLLFLMESRLAQLNDHYEKEVVEPTQPAVPVRLRVQDPPPVTVTEAVTRALEQRLSKLIGGSVMILAVDIPLSRGVVDLLAVDKRGRLLLIFIPTAMTIENVRSSRPSPLPLHLTLIQQHIAQIDDTRGCFYALRSLPSSTVTELTCCFTKQPPPNPPSMALRSAVDVRALTSLIVSFLLGSICARLARCCRQGSIEP
jgi:hypothetical protein